jgi:Flp pilus assembly protein TadD
LLEQDRIREAGLATQRAIDLDPTRSAPWNNLGLIFERAGNHEQALKLFLRALECDPGNTGAMNNIASPLIALGRSSEAITHLEKAARLAPDKLGVWITLGSLLHGRGERDRAFQCFNSAIVCVPLEERSNLIEAIRRVAPEFSAK